MVLRLIELKVALRVEDVIALANCRSRGPSARGARVGESELLFVA